MLQQNPVIPVPKRPLVISIYRTIKKPKNNWNFNEFSGAIIGVFISPVNNMPDAGFI